MTLTEKKSGKIIGSVHDPFECCNPYYVVKDENKNVRYRILGSCCQKGFYCCSDIFFYIYPAGDSAMSEENAIGKITKVWTDCPKECCTNANDFHTEFPKDATAEDKLLLISVTLLIDYSLFEREQQNGQGA